MRETLSSVILDTHDTHVLASAAPGTDLIAHEICREMDVASTVCLPMPPDDFSARTFIGWDEWRTRFLELMGTGAPLL